MASNPKAGEYKIGHKVFVRYKSSAEMFIGVITKISSDPGVWPITVRAARSYYPKLGSWQNNLIPEVLTNSNEIRLLSTLPKLEKSLYDIE